MLCRYLIASAVTVCLSAQPIWADEYDEARARIETLTEAQAIRLAGLYLSDQSADCRVELRREDFADEEATLTEVLVSMLTNLQVPAEYHAELAPMLELRLDSFDEGMDERMFAQMDVMFEIVSQNDERVVLLERNCQVLGS